MLGVGGSGAGVGEEFPGSVEEGAGVGSVVAAGGEEDVEGWRGGVGETFEELGGAVEEGEDFVAEGEEAGGDGGCAGAGEFLVAGGEGGEELEIGVDEGAVFGEVGGWAAEFETVVGEGDGGVGVYGADGFGTRGHGILEVMALLADGRGQGSADGHSDFARLRMKRATSACKPTPPPPMTAPGQGWPVEATYVPAAMKERATIRPQIWPRRPSAKSRLRSAIVASSMRVCNV